MKPKFLLITLTAVFLAGMLLFPLFRPLPADNNPSVSPTGQRKQFSLTQKITLVQSGQTTTDTITVTEGETALDVLKRTKPIETKDYSFGTAVESIDGVANGTGGRYWIYYVNDKEMQVGAGAYQVQPNDLIEWKFKLESE